MWISRVINEVRRVVGIIYGLKVNFDLHFKLPPRWNSKKETTYQFSGSGYRRSVINHRKVQFLHVLFAYEMWTILSLCHSLQQFNLLCRRSINSPNYELRTVERYGFKISAWRPATWLRVYFILLVPSGKYRNSALNQTTSAPFHINFLFIIQYSTCNTTQLDLNTIYMQRTIQSKILKASLNKVQMSINTLHSDAPTR